MFISVYNNIPSTIPPSVETNGLIYSSKMVNFAHFLHFTTVNKAVDFYGTYNPQWNSWMLFSPKLMSNTTPVRGRLSQKELLPLSRYMRTRIPLFTGTASRQVGCMVF